MTEEKKEYKIDGRPSTIYRVVKNKENPYVMIDRRPVDNPSLSFKSKGILTYLLSRPDGWEVSVADLIKHGKEGEGAVRSGLKELMLAGHMKYTVSRHQGRITGWLIEVFEIPISPDLNFQDVDNPDVENRTQVILKALGKKKKEEEGKRPEIFIVYEQEIGPLTPSIADKLTEAEAVHTGHWVCEALKIASSNGKRNWSYADSILTRWKSEGYGSEYKPKNGNGKSGFKSAVPTPPVQDDFMEQLRKKQERAESEL